MEDGPVPRDRCPVRPPSSLSPLSHLAPPPSPKGKPPPPGGPEPPPPPIPPYPPYPTAPAVEHMISMGQIGDTTQCTAPQGSSALPGGFGEVAQPNGDCMALYSSDGWYFS